MFGKHTYVLALVLSACIIPAAHATDRLVTAGSSLQAALDAAQPGDTITLQAGAEFVGNFVLPNKGSSTSWITIQSSAMSSLPPAGVRVTPVAAPNMPRITAPNEWAVISFGAGAHHWKLQGLNIYSNTGIYSYGVVTIGNGSETNVADLPSNIAVDRCWIHGDPNVGSKRGIALNSVSTTVTNSWFDSFMSNWHDTQAIGGWNGPGPYEITNNHVEATGEAVAFGGTVPTIIGQIPSDITIRRNHFYKPLSWQGTTWVVKNHLEFKFGRRITVDSNVFDNCWSAAQAGFAIQLTVRTEHGLFPQAVIDTLTFTNNLLRGSSAGVNILGTDDDGSGGLASNLTFRNNVFADISAARWGGLGRLFQVLNGTQGLTFDHNTSFQDGPFLTMDYPTPAVNFVYNNNINYGNPSILGNGTGWGIPTLDKYAPGYTMRRNVFVGGTGYMLPSDNYTPESTTLLNFVDFTGGNYTLRTDSPYYATSTDGKPAGADFAAIAAATLNVVVPANGTQPLPPTPSAAAPTGPQITGVTLINTQTQKPVAGYNPIPNGANININRLGLATFNIRVEGANMQSVVEYVNNSRYRVDNYAPFSLAGDAVGTLFPWFVPTGNYKLALTPYSALDGTGTAGTPYSISFTIVR